MSQVFFLPLLAFAFTSFGFQQTDQRATPSHEQQIGESVRHPTMTCTPQSPTVMSGDSIKIRAWLDGHSDRLRYVWTASAGTIKGQEAEAEWDFRGVSPGIYESSVTVAVNGASASCKLQVVVRERPMGGMHATAGRSLLVNETSEVKGYGLYSYLLFGQPPDDSSRDRYLGVLGAFLQEMDEIEKLEHLPFVERNQLNITYLPVDAAASSGVSPEWALAHYDYARARIMLAKLPGTHLSGPYIVSVLKPLGAAQSISGPYLFQDLSLVPPREKDLLIWWLREFQRQAGQERFWEEDTGRQLALKMRTIVAILATAVPEVRKGLDTAIAWIR
jgi:hypothetical protein